jgi:glutamate formiminotransferase/formiminotetrahydrofolate cyclodeaminase
VPAQDRPDLNSAALSLGTFVERLASADPVPGGGSASAVAASLAAGLVVMVAGLSEGRPKYAEHAALHARAAETTRRLAVRFIELSDEDARAYSGFVAAMKLPRGTDDEKATRRAALQVAAREAAEAPLGTVEACLELVVAAESLVGRSNSNAASDLNVAALLGEAAARGAAENVLVNLPAVGDDEYAATTTARVMGLIDDIRDFVAATHAGVRNGDAREPLPE